MTVFKNIYASYIERWEIRKANTIDHIVTIDNDNFEKFRQLFGPNKTSLIYNFTNLFPIAVDTDKKYDLIYIGGISEPRGIIQIIEAVYICKKEHPQIKFILLGNFHANAFRIKVMALIDQLDLKDNIEYISFIPHNLVEKYLSTSKIGIVVLQPIPKYYKNIPIKQFEYMAFGLPVIGSNLPPIEDFIKPVDAGIIVDPTKPEEIASAICNLLADAKLYERLSLNALNAAREKYNWQLMENKLIELYKNILLE